MAYLNANIPTLTCFIKNEFMFNHEKGHGEFTYSLLIGHTKIEIC